MNGLLLDFFYLFQKDFTCLFDELADLVFSWENLRLENEAADSCFGDFCENIGNFVR
jgi:hypothetical protein